MNILRTIPIGLLAVGLTTASSPAFGAGAAPAATPSFQVLIDVPPSARPLFDSDVSQALGSLLSDAFHRAGYAGEPVLLAGLNSVKSGQPLVTLSLSEWRVDHTGTVKCEFNASLKIDGKTQDLGQYHGSALNVAADIPSVNRTLSPGQPAGSMLNSATHGHSDSRVWQQDALDEAANTALKKLYVDLAKTSQLPGFKLKHS